MAEQTQIAFHSKLLMVKIGNICTLKDEITPPRESRQSTDRSPRQSSISESSKRPWCFRIARSNICWWTATQDLTY